MKQITCLHGFLGTPADWNFLPYKNMHIPNLFSEPIKSFSEWSEGFNASLQKNDNVLIGYSLGGRLAMHALIANPERFSCAIIISAHYGLNTTEERKQRLINDFKWAKSIREQPWQYLMDQWNAQSVFDNDIIRRERDYDRNTLAEAMTTWSLGNQECLINDLEKLNIPILWIAGGKDTKYAALAKLVSLRHPQSRIWVAKESGHRLPWEIQNDFFKQADKFIKTRT